MLRLTCLLALLFPLAGCAQNGSPKSQGGHKSEVSAGLVDTTEQETSNAKLERPRFAWSPLLSVRVTDVAQKDETRMTSQFWLDLCRIDQNTLSLSFREFKILELNGKLASDPSIANALLRVETLAAAIPTMFIDSEGNYSGIENPDELFFRMQETFPDRNFDQLRVILQRPGAGQLFEHAVGKYRRA